MTEQLEIEAASMSCHWRSAWPKSARLLLLASSDSSLMTGGEVFVDGGGMAKVGATRQRVHVRPKFCSLTTAESQANQILVPKAMTCAEIRHATASDCRAPRTKVKQALLSSEHRD
jgi:hypothetical protein